jgi:two-component system sensor histidine kinase KdpD
VAAGNLQSTWLSEEQRREQTDVVLSEVGRLSRLFESILDMARIDAGAVAATRQWVVPAEIADAARAQVEHALKGHAVDVRDDSSDLVLLDPRLAASALAHLLANAGAYSPADAPIIVTIATSNDGLRLTVRDRGPGIAASDLPHLFDRFFRGTAASGTTGTGMGLSIARGLLAVEHGRVWAENHPDGGAVFTIEIPAASRPAATTVGTSA